MAWFRVENSRRCVRLAERAWLGAFAWFALALFGSVGYLGPGPAFLAWSAPAVVIFALSIRWLRDVGAKLSATRVAISLIAWGVLAAAAWDGGDRWVPEWTLPAFWPLLLGFPFAITLLMLRMARQVDSGVAAV